MPRLCSDIHFVFGLLRVALFAQTLLTNYDIAKQVVEMYQICPAVRENCAGSGPDLHQCQIINARNLSAIVGCEVSVTTNHLPTVGLAH